MNADTATKTILLIDDDLSIRFVIKKLISRSFDFARIFTSSDAVQGLGYTFLLKPEIVIVDTTLPAYGDLEVLDYIATNKYIKEAKTAVIVLYDNPKYINPELGYTFIDKRDHHFLDKLLESLGHLLNKKPQANDRTLGWLKSISKRVIKYSDKSDRVITKLYEANILVKLYCGVKWLFYQLLTGMYMTLFYVVGGGDSQIELNSQQQRQDTWQTRLRYYPTIAFFMVALFTASISSIAFGSTAYTFYNLTLTRVFAISYTWDGGGIDNDWSTCENWSSDTCPTATDTAIFDGTSTKNATIDVDFQGTLAGMSINAGYTGTITQARSFTINGDLSQSDGTFTGATQAISIGNLTMPGGIFTTTSGNMTINGQVDITTGTFNSNGGTITFASTLDVDVGCNNTTFDRAIFAGDASMLYNVHSTCNFVVGADPTIPNALRIDGATFTGSGDMHVQRWLVLINNPIFHTDFDTLYASSEFGLLLQATVDLSMFDTVTVEETISMDGTPVITPPTQFVLRSNLNIQGPATYNNPSNLITFQNSDTIGIHCADIDLGNVQFNGTGQSNIDSDCEINIGNNAVVSGDISLTGAITGTGTLTINGSLILNSGADLDLSTYSDVDVNGNIAILAGSSLTSTAGILHVQGELFTNTSSAFVHNSGTVNFDSNAGPNGIATGDSIVFYNLSKISTTPDDELRFLNDTDVTIVNNTTLKGVDSNSVLTLRSPSNGAEWRFDPQGTRDFVNLFVRDSDNTSGTEIETASLNITNGGNNTNWDFPPMPYPPISGYTVSPYGSNLVQYDLISGLSLSDAPITLSGFTVEAGTGLATDPITCSVYGILKLQGEATRSLVTINTGTGEATLVGDTGKRFAGITFDLAGNLYGVTGDGEADLPSSLYSINKTTGAASLIVQFNTTGDGGETIAYNPVDGFIYHFSGSEDELVFQKVNLGDNSITDISLSTFWEEEFFGMTYAASENLFIASTIENEILRVSASGVVSDLITTADYIKGFAINGCVPQVAPDAPTAVGPASQTNGSTISDTTPTFNFSLSDGNGGDSVAYQIQIDDNADFSSPVLDYTSGLAAQGAREFTVGQDTAGGGYAVGAPGQVLAPLPYYWRVKGLDSGGRQSAYINANSGNVAFIVQGPEAPAAPAALGPDNLTDGSITADSTPDFAFNLTDPNSSDNVGYHIQIDDNADFSSPIVGYISALTAQGIQYFSVGQDAGSGTYTSGGAGQALASGEYYWRIQTIDSTQTSVFVIANGGAIAFRIDITPPTGEIFINFDAGTGDNHDVYIIFEASDNLSPISSVIFSENLDFSGAEYIAFDTQALYHFSDGLEVKSLYIRFKDSAGNESEVYGYFVDLVARTVIPMSAATGEPVLYSIALVFLDDAGQPIPGLFVILTKVNDDQFEPQVGSTDDNGIVIFSELEPGQYQVQGEFTGREFNQTVEVGDDSQEALAIILARASLIEQILSQATLQPLALVAAVTATLATIAVIVPTLAVAPNAIGSVFGLIFGFFLPKKRYWGIIFDTETSRSIPFAVVNLINEDTKEIVQSAVTDLQGKYRLNVGKGNYALEIRASGYEIFRRKLNTSYFFSEEHDLVVDVPLIRSVGTNPVLKLISYHKQQLLSMTGVTAFILSIWGFFVTLDAIIKDASLFNLVVLALYLGLFCIAFYPVIYNVRLKRGMSIDAKTGTKLPGVAVRIYDEEKQVALSLSNKDGIARFNLQEGQYFANATKRGYLIAQEPTTHKYGLIQREVKKNGYMNKDILLNQVSTIGGESFLDNPFS
jgi:hypothetical protein